MRIIVYGAGAVGGVIAGRLAQHREHHGHDVLAIARGAHLDAIRARGLTLVDHRGTAVVPLQAAGHPREIEWRDGDVMMLAMKSQHTEAALDDLLGSCAPPDLPIVCAQNGVANERTALRRFEHVYGMCVMLPGTHLEPGVVVTSLEPVSGVLDVGRFPTGTDDVAETLAAALRASDFLSVADPAVMAKKHTKLLMNLGNAIDAAVGAQARRGELYRRARAEALAVFEAAGIERQDDDAERAVRAQTRMADIPGYARVGSSTAQSLARSAGSAEVDYLNGEVCLLGRLHGVPTPVNAMLQRVVNRMARTGQPPGSLTLETLEAELERGLDHSGLTA